MTKIFIKKWIANKINADTMSYNRFVERPEKWVFDIDGEKVESVIIRGIKKETEKAVLVEVSTLKQFGRYATDCLRTNKGFDFWIPKSAIVTDIL